MRLLLYKKVFFSFFFFFFEREQANSVPKHYSQFLIQMLSFNTIILFKLTFFNLLLNYLIQDMSGPYFMIEMEKKEPF